jgi:hypothetical protein
MVVSGKGQITFAKMLKDEKIQQLQAACQKLLWDEETVPALQTEARSGIKGTQIESDHLCRDGEQSDCYPSTA